MQFLLTFQTFLETLLQQVLTVKIKQTQPHRLAQKILDLLAVVLIICYNVVLIIQYRLLITLRKTVTLKVNLVDFMVTEHHLVRQNLPLVWVNQKIVVCQLVKKLKINHLFLRQTNLMMHLKKPELPELRRLNGTVKILIPI